MSGLDVEQELGRFGLGAEDLEAWRDSGLAEDGSVDWLTDRVARRPAGKRARTVYGAEEVHDFARRAILDALELEPGDHLLDVGCGGGLLLRDAMARGARTTGIDHSEDMVGLARGGEHGADVVLAEAEKLPFAGRGLQRDCHGDRVLLPRGSGWCTARVPSGAAAGWTPRHIHDRPRAARNPCCARAARQQGSLPRRRGARWAGPRRRADRGGRGEQRRRAVAGRAQAVTRIWLNRGQGRSRVDQSAFGLPERQLARGWGRDHAPPAGGSLTRLQQDARASLCALSVIASIRSTSTYGSQRARSVGRWTIPPPIRGPSSSAW